MSLTSLYQRLSETWYSEPSAHAALVQAILSQLGTASWVEKPSSANPSREAGYVTQNGVAIVSLNGIMALRPDPMERKYLGIVAMEDIAASLEAIAKDSSIHSAVLHVTSPGGTANGSGELAAQVKALNAIKPVVAFADIQMCSAAYQLASQASKIIATPSAQVGSVGCMLTRMDTSKMLKSMGVDVQVFRNSDSPLKGMSQAVPLTKEQEAHLQSTVDQHAQSFKRDVQTGRPGIKAEAMRGQTEFGEKALSLGLVDQIGDYASSLAAAAQAGITKLRGAQVIQPTYVVAPSKVLSTIERLEARVRAEDADQNIPSYSL